MPLSMVAFTVTSPPKPLAVAVISSPLGASATPMEPVVILPFSAFRVTVEVPVYPSFTDTEAVPSFFTETVVLSSCATTTPGSAVSALPALDSASLAASTTAVEVMVAPEIASMPSPSVRGADLPINWLVKSSSMARWPRPAVSPLASTEKVAIAPFSTVRLTVTSLAKPLAVASSTSAPAEAGADRALFTASTAA